MKLKIQKQFSPSPQYEPKLQGLHSEAKATLLTILDLKKRALLTLLNLQKRLPAKEMILLLEIRCTGQINANPPISDPSSCHIVLPYLSSEVLYDPVGDELEDAMSFVSRAVVLGRNNVDLDKNILASALMLKGSLHTRQVVATCIIGFPTPV
jgi:hypothetical protein